jgi:hypothetical protein
MKNQRQISPLMERPNRRRDSAYGTIAASDSFSSLLVLTNLTLCQVGVV